MVVTLLVALVVISFASQGTPWLALMVLLGATAGIAMGLSFPFSLPVKQAFIFGVIVSGVAIVFGSRYSAKTYGQILAVVGIVAWATLGVFGLGTSS